MSIIPAGNSWTGGRAPLSYKFRACNDKRDPSGEAHGTEQVALHQPGLLMPSMFLPCQVFS